MSKAGLKALKEAKSKQQNGLDKLLGISKPVLPLGIGLQIGLKKNRPNRLHNKSRMNREVHVRF